MVDRLAGWVAAWLIVWLADWLTVWLAERSGGGVAAGWLWGQGRWTHSLMIFHFTPAGLCWRWALDPRPGGWLDPRPGGRLDPRPRWAAGPPPRWATAPPAPVGGWSPARVGGVVVVQGRILRHQKTISISILLWRKAGHTGTVHWADFKFLTQLTGLLQHKINVPTC